MHMPDTLPPTLSGAAHMLRSAYPGGMPDTAYFAVLALLYEHFSDRNLVERDLHREAGVLRLFCFFRLVHSCSRPFCLLRFCLCQVDEAFRSKDLEDIACRPPFRCCRPSGLCMPQWYRCIPEHRRNAASSLSVH